MKHLLLILAIITLTSCITEKKRAKICNNCPTETTIIERDCTYIYRDSFPVIIPSDSTLLELYLKCVDGKVTIVDYSRIRGMLIEMGYKLENDKLTVVANTIDTAAIIAQYEKEFNKRTREVVKEVVKTQESPFKFRWWYIPLIFIISIFLIGTLIQLILRITFYK